MVDPIPNSQIQDLEQQLNELQRPFRGFTGFLHEKLNDSSVVEVFFEAIKNQDKALFFWLFDRFSYQSLMQIDGMEGLNALKPPLNHSPVSFTEEDFQNIRDYIRDSKFSGIVAISDGKTTRVITSSNITDPNTPFSIHSIGKIFTGVLALRLIEEKIIPESALDQPIQLDPQIIERLSEEVREQLNKTTLRQVMLHQGRYGDFLQGYFAAVENSLKKGQPVPKIGKPEDFLEFADKKLVELDPSGEAYSNLGFLLVGLSLQHLYNSSPRSSQTGSLTYHEILQRFVLEPAEITNFATHMPSNGCVNPKDEVSLYNIGSPSGGYWTTAVTGK